MKTIKFIALFLTLLPMSSCLRMSGRALDELKSSAETESYTVRPGDTLNIDVYGEPSLSGEKAVREDGQPL